MKSFRLIGKIVGKVFPAKIISTFFGMGYLPIWQEYWASFLALVISYILLYLSYGSFLLLYDITGIAFVVTIFFLKLSIVFLALQTIAVFIFQINNPSANSNENIVVHIVLAQLFVVALAMPATLAIFHSMAGFYDQICKKMFICPKWINSFIYFCIFFIIPYIFFNIIVMIKPWPIVTIQLHYNNVLSITAEGAIYMLYTIVLIYLVACIFFDLTIHDANIFNRYIFNNIKALNADLYNISKKLV
ncbi:phosphatidylglycerophosphatase [Candidatus Mesenet endosymbiont of Agriotes lineatus]|uniref:phosphatidylglycerophosphatase n=1 Tax=Candidatus Mesenet endosymbiont of Agriotes lineatus TaxID=3077948 RepID=UPI0030D20273